MGQTLSGAVSKPYIIIHHKVNNSANRPALVEPPAFVSLGMMTLLRNGDQPKIKGHVLEGPGLYATFGARLFSPDTAKNIGCVIIPGNGFPYSLYRTLASWNINLVVHRPKKPAPVNYQRGPYSQKPVSTAIEPIIAPIYDTVLLSANSFHFFGLPSEVAKQVTNLFELRKHRNIANEPVIVWETASQSFNENNLSNMDDALPLVEIFSPSYEDLPSADQMRTRFIRQTIEQEARSFCQRGIGPDRTGVTVIRCGTHGCFYMRNEEEKGWVNPIINNRSVDPTGSSSAFLGAFTDAYLKNASLEECCLRGQVAATLALEQFGLPQMTKPLRSGMETWNNLTPFFQLEHHTQYYMFMRSHPEYDQI